MPIHINLEVQLNNEIEVKVKFISPIPDSDFPRITYTSYKLHRRITLKSFIDMLKLDSKLYGSDTVYELTEIYY